MCCIYSVILLVLHYTSTVLTLQTQCLCFEPGAWSSSPRVTAPSPYARPAGRPVPGSGQAGKKSSSLDRGRILILEEEGMIVIGEFG